MAGTALAPYESAEPWAAEAPDDREMARREQERLQGALRAIAGAREAEADRRVGIRQPIERRWLTDLQQYHGIYDPETQTKEIGAALRYGVLNVPGAAWTHYIPKSVLFDMLSPLLDSGYRGVVNAQHALAMTQGIWDEVDGAAWASALKGREAAFLIQESIGDPVVPNAGSEMVAVVTTAQQVGAELVPIPAQIQRATEVSRGSAITQYKVGDTGAYDIHGFAGRDTPAGRAARSQIVDFVQSIWQTGAAKITVPAACTGGSCDFSRRP